MSLRRLRRSLIAEPLVEQLDKPKARAITRIVIYFFIIYLWFASLVYKKIDEKLKKHANDYTYEESREIGKLKGECVAGFANGVKQNVGDKANNLRGFIEGLVGGFGDMFKH